MHVYLKELKEPQEASTLLSYLYKATCECADSYERVWKYLPVGPFTSFKEFEDSFAPSLSENSTWQVFVVCVPWVVGTVSIEWYSPVCAEIARVFYAPSAQRTFANLETNYKLLCYLFEETPCRRVIWKCHPANIRSRESAEKMGFTFKWFLDDARGSCFFEMEKAEWIEGKKDALRRRIDLRRAEIENSQ